MPLIKTEPVLDPQELFQTISEIAYAGIGYARTAGRVTRIRCSGCSHAPHRAESCVSAPAVTREKRCACDYVDGMAP